MKHAPPGRIARLIRRITTFDPALRELRGAMISMLAVLCTFGCGLFLRNWAELHDQALVQAVLLALTFARTQRGNDLTDRLNGLLVLPVTTAAAVLLGVLMSRHHLLGDTVFVLALFLTIWVRRFGHRITKIGTVTTLPLVSTLVTESLASPSIGVSSVLCAALLATVAAVAVPVLQFAAARTRFGEPAVRARPPRPDGAAGKRIPANVRMAAQMAVSVAIAFLVGRMWFPDHWTWVVLTAFIVCSGARGRADVVYKGLLRAFGAAAGTAAATVIAGLNGPHQAGSVVLIFGVLTIAAWLRNTSYAFWAAGITAALSLLYGYYGQSAPGLLWTRLELIALGAIIGMTVSWTLLPIRTRDVARRRIADALATLSDIVRLCTGGPADRAELPNQQIRYVQRIALLQQIARPLEVQRALFRRRPQMIFLADAIDALGRCTRPVSLLVTDAAEGRPRTDRKTTALGRELLRDLGAVRRTLGKQPGDGYHGPTMTAARSLPASPVAGALLQLHGEIAELARVLGTPKLPPTPENHATGPGGVVVDRQGNPISDAGVTLIDGRGRQVGHAVTDHTGVFGFPARTAPPLVLLATHVDHWPEALAVSGDPGAPFTVTLVRRARLYGTVRAGDTPLPHAMVTLLDGESNVVRRRQTDEAGRYEFRDLWPGRYQVVANGYPPSASTTRVLRERPIGNHDVWLGYPLPMAPAPG